MQATSNAIQLKASSETKNIETEWIKYGAEGVGGKLEEDIDFNLVEDWQNVRVTIDIKFQADSPLGHWLVETFFIATDKQVVIDSETIDVVMAQPKLDFKLWKKYNFRSDITLNLKVKSAGYPWVAGLQS